MHYELCTTEAGKLGALAGTGEFFTLELDVEPNRLRVRAIALAPVAILDLPEAGERALLLAAALESSDDAHARVETVYPIRLLGCESFGLRPGCEDSDSSDSHSYFRLHSVSDSDDRV